MHIHQHYPYSIIVVLATHRARTKRNILHLIYYINNKFNQESIRILNYNQINIIKFKGFYKVLIYVLKRKLDYLLIEEPNLHLRVSNINFRFIIQLMINLQHNHGIHCKIIQKILEIKLPKNKNHNNKRVNYKTLIKKENY
jgi:hypothetical protein